MQFKRLFEPGYIGKMEVKNRIVAAPMVINYAGAMGEATDIYVKWCERLAQGGTGVIILESALISPDYNNKEKSGRHCAAQLGVYDDYCIPHLSRLAQAIKDYDARAVIQLHHGGRQAFPTLKTTVAPSPVYEEFTDNSPRELTIDEIEEIEEFYSDAVVRAATAGFDGVELHGAHGYIIAQFFSAATNKRTDKYGGSLENRMRFGLNVLRLSRKKIGRDFPIIWRNSVKEALPDGITFDQVKVLAKELEKVGVDCLSLSGGGYGTENILWLVQPNSFAPGVLVPYAEEMKREKIVDMPIIIAGKLSDPYLAEEVLEKGKADFIGICRGLIADADLPRKTAEGRPEDIRKCICCTLCVHEVLNSRIMRCSVNPLVGREWQEITKAEKVKKVMVIGAGPAGMEAARVCALRGHEVTLYEKTKELGGGQLKLATVAPHKEELKGIAAYYAVQLKKLGVKQKLGVEVTASLVKRVKPDVVVVATGAEPDLLEIPGAKKKKVVSSWDVLSGKAKVGKTVVVVGGGLIGCDTAEYLVEQGKQVTITTRQEKIGYNMEFVNRNALMLRFAEENVRIETQVSCKEVTNEGIVAADKWGKEISIKAETVILAVRIKSVNSLKKELSWKVPELYVIGDAKEPRKIVDAIAEGFMLGRRV